MSDELSFADVIGRLKAGDSEAARIVFQRFAHRLIGLARVHLDARLRQKVDPEDVLQSVYRSFFVRHGKGQFELEDWDGLWALLTVLTVRKCGRWRERFFTERRDLRRETPQESDADDSDHPEQDVSCRQPAPEEVVAMAEMVETLLEGLGVRSQQIVSMRLQGYTIAEIAAETKLSERSVQTILQTVRQRLTRARDQAA